MTLSRPRHRSRDAGHSLQRLRCWLRFERFHRRYRGLGLFALRFRLIQRIHVAHAGLSQLVIAQPKPFLLLPLSEPFVKRLHAVSMAFADGFSVRA